MKRLGRRSRWIAGALLLLAAGLLAVHSPPVRDAVRESLAERLAATTGFDVRIGALDYDLLRLQARAEQVRLADRPASAHPFLVADALSLQLSPSLLRGVVWVDRLDVSGARLVLRRAADGGWNLPRSRGSGDETRPESVGPTGPPPIGRIRVDGLEIALDDAANDLHLSLSDATFASAQPGHEALSADLTIPALETELRGVVARGHARARLGFDGRRLEVQGLEIVTDALRLEGGGTLDVHGPAPELALRFRGGLEADALALALPSTARTRGSVRFELGIEGARGSPRFTLSADSPEIEVGASGPLSLSVAGHHASGTSVLRSLEVAGFGGSAEADGELTWGEHASGRLNLRARQLPLRRLVALWGPETPPALTCLLDAEASLSWEGPTLRALSGSLEARAIQESPSAGLSGTMHAGLDAGRYHSTVHLDLPELGVVARAGGTLDEGDLSASTLEGRVEARLQDLRRLGALATSLGGIGDVPEDLAGGLRVEAALSGSLSAPVLRGEVRSTELQVATVGPLSARAQLTLADAVLHVAGARIEDGPNAVDAAGSLDLRAGTLLADLSVELPDVSRLASLFPEGTTPASGHLQAQARLEGPIADPGAQGRLTLGDAKGEGWTIDTADVAFETHGGHAVLDLGALRGTAGGLPVSLELPGRLLLGPTSVAAEGVRLVLGEGSHLSLGGGLAETDGLRLELLGHATDLAPLLAPGGEAPNVSGRLEAEVVLRGSLERVTFVGSAETASLELRVRDLPEPVSVQARLELDDGRLRLTRFLGSWRDARLTASGALPLHLARRWLPSPVATAVPTRNEPARLEATLGAATAATLLAMATGTSPSVPAEGDVRARLQLEAAALALGAVRARLDLQRAALELPGTSLALSEPAAVVVENGRLRLSGFTWTGSHGWLGLEGEGSADGEDLRARITGDLGLRVLDAVFPVAAEGRISLDLGLERTQAGSLELLGSVGLDRAGFVTKDPDVDVSGLTGRLVLDRDIVRLEDVSASVNGGAVVAAGEIGITRDAPLHVELRGESLGLTLYPELRGEVDVDLTLSGSPEAPRLGGRLDIVHAAYRGRRGLYAVYSDLVERWAPPERATLVTAEPPALLKRLLLDVDMASDDVSWDNAYGRLAARVDLALRGTAAEPALDGIASLRPGGNVLVGGTAVEVRSGALRWDETRGLEPRIALSAYGRVSRYDVELRATGGPEDLDLALSSQPPLSETELLGLIVTGSTSGASGDADAQASRDLAVGTVSRTALASLSERVGLRGVRISNAPVSLFGSDTTSRLTVAVHLSRRFELVRSQKLSEGSGTTQGVVWHPTRSLDATVYQEDADLVFEARHRLELGSGDTAPARPRPEQPRVARVALEGELPLPESLLRQRLRLEPGDRFDFFRWHDDQERLLDFLRTHGFREARLAARRSYESDGRIALTYELDPGSRTRLRFEGMILSKGQRRQIEEAWGWAPSDPLLAADLERATRLVLGKHGYVEAAVRARIDREPRGVPIKEAVLEIEPGPRGRGHDIVFEGASLAEAESLQDLLEASGLRERGFVERATLEAVVTDDYVARGHLAARVRTAPPRVEEGRARLRVSVDPGPVYRLASVDVELPPTMVEVATPDVGLHPGDPYLPLEDAGAGLRLERQYRRLGYNDARVETTRETDPETAGVALTFAVSAGPRQVVSEVALANAAEAPGDVRRVLQGQVDRPASPEAWLPVQRELFGSGRYRDAEVAFEPLDESPPGHDQQMRAVVELQPWPRWILEYGLSVRDSPSDPGRLSLPTFVPISAERRNLLGLPLTARLEAGVGHRLRAAQGELNAARLFGRRVLSRLYVEHLRLGIDLDTDAESILRDLEVRYTEFGAEQHWRRGRGDLTYGYRLTRANVSLILGPLAEPLEVVQVVSSPYATYIHDRRDQPLDARHGHFHSSSFSFGLPAFGSDFRFERYLGKQFGYGMVGPIVLAGGVRLGVSSGLDDDRNPTSDLVFRAGGGSTVRGYEENSLGPVDAQGVNGGGGLLILNAETRVSLNSWLEAAVFADAGNVWETTPQISLSDLQFGLGFGLRIRLPFVALRLDLGFPTPRRERDEAFRLHFGIGQAF